MAGDGDGRGEGDKAGGGGELRDGGMRGCIDGGIGEGEGKTKRQRRKQRARDGDAALRSDVLASSSVSSLQLLLGHVPCHLRREEMQRVGGGGG